MSINTKLTSKTASNFSTTPYTIVTAHVTSLDLQPNQKAFTDTWAPNSKNNYIFFNLCIAHNSHYFRKTHNKK